MSRNGNCFDNAAIESFFGTLKAEYFQLQRPDSIDTLEAGVHDYIHYYNHERIKLGCRGSVRWNTDWEAPPNRRNRDRPTSGGQFKTGAIQFVDGGNRCIMSATTGLCVFDTIASSQTKLHCLRLYCP